MGTILVRMPGVNPIMSKKLLLIRILLPPAGVWPTLSCLVRFYNPAPGSQAHSQHPGNLSTSVFAGFKKRSCSLAIYLYLFDS